MAALPDFRVTIEDIRNVFRQTQWKIGAEKLLK